MEDLTEGQKRYLERLKLEQQEELAEHAELIDAFKIYCASRGITLSEDSFGFTHTIGIVVTHPNLLQVLCPDIAKDKEGLFDFRLLSSQYRKRPGMSGFIYADNFMIMAHPYFRRGMHGINNFAPRFVDLFWNNNFDGIDPYIALDSDRVRINVDNLRYMEADMWFGARFTKDIACLEDGIAHLRPPLDVESNIISFCFNDVYSLDIKWETENGIKSFYAEEFKTIEITIEKNQSSFHPVRYIHAEFDIARNHFRHFDGAVHFYTTEEYNARRDSDLNYNSKNSSHIKAKSEKLFKFNGSVSVEVWCEYVSHFLTGNPLIIEYFEGKYPDRITEIIEAVRTNKLKRNE
jgi:hypothetical protein